MTLAETAALIRRAALALGYVRCGITTADPFPEFIEAIRRILARHPERAELYEGFLSRGDPRHNAPWARAIVVAVRRYGVYRLPAELVGRIGRNYLCDRRVPAHPEHSMPARMKAYLRSLGLRVKSGSGTSDRWAAARAGVVRLGRNTFAFAEGCGSWINIECWRVDAELPPDPPTPDDPCPPDCRRCLRACPTGALCRPREIRMERCIAWLTYAEPWPIAPELWRRMGTWIYGCDACQEACSLNEGMWEERLPLPWPEETVARWHPERLAEMSDEEYRAFVHPFFWYIAPEDAERWRANARRSLAAERGEGNREMVGRGT